ncbi:MAG: hypothetical protein AB1846_00210 [Chloroflexota bacterium]
MADKTSRLDNLNDLEAQLAGTLKPVAPSTASRSGIQKRIRIPEARLLSARLSDWRSLIAVFSGVMSAALVLITVTRALFFFYRRAKAG